MQKFLELCRQFENTEYVIEEDAIVFDNKLGDGASGTTYLGHYQNEKVAIKVYSASILKNDFNSVKNELQIMSTMRHKNIVQFKGLYLRKDPPGAALVTRFAEKGELGHVLYNSRLVRKRGDAMRFKIVLGLAEGLKYLHSKDVIHRDIKPANILLDDDYEPMLTDFGFSRFIDHDQNRQMTGETGSYRYMAPEVTSHSRYSEKADTYSFALICNEIFMDERPFEYQISLVVARDVVVKNLRPSQKKIKNERLKDIIARCWDLNPELRPGWDEVISELEIAKKEMEAKKARSALSSLFRKKHGAASSSSTEL
ncbi:unnamed protein product [Agarophyton chilense]